jgi:hypothetical protein
MRRISINSLMLAILPMLLNPACLCLYVSTTLILSAVPNVALGSTISLLCNFQNVQTDYYQNGRYAGRKIIDLERFAIDFDASSMMVTMQIVVPNPPSEKMNYRNYSDSTGFNSFVQITPREVRFGNNACRFEFDRDPTCSSDATIDRRSGEIVLRSTSARGNTEDHGACREVQHAF